MENQEKLDLMAKHALQEWGYEEISLLGKGAFSVVYRVRECGSTEYLACKVSKERAMLMREAGILGQVRHTLFPEGYGIKQSGEMSFLFMEYVEGINLKALLDAKGRLEERRAAQIGVALAEGLCYLHERNTPILFRDVKPQNIMIGENGKVTLLDFGSAGKTDVTDVITGTPGYAAPEQWVKGDKVGFYSDVYALGKVMLYMLTGKNGKGSYPEMADIWSGVKLHSGVKSLVEDCIRENADSRVPNMRSFLHRMKPYSTGKKIKILCSEAKVHLERRTMDAYIFQQNIMKTE